MMYPRTTPPPLYFLWRMVNPYSRYAGNEYKEHIKKIVLPIFNKVLQETKENTMIGVRPIVFFWRPNNYRLQFNFKTETFKRNTTLKSGVTISNFNTKYTIKNFYDSTLMVDIPKKNKQGKITIIYKPSTRAYYEIKCSSLEEIDRRINEKVHNIEEKLLYALKRFILRFGGIVEWSTKKWVRFEDDIHGEDFIDKIPRNMVITDTYFKKVYKKGVEFKNPAYVKSYISNRVVEEMSPEIADSINGLGLKFDSFIDKVTPVIENLSSNMATHVKIMKGIEKGITDFNSTIKKLNNKLDQKTLNKWCK
jgi:hypothetical protein